MGEVFINGDPKYAGPYQEHLDGVFNNRLSDVIDGVFGTGSSMYNLKGTFDQDKSHFKDIEALGIYVDNMFRPRYMSKYGDGQMFMNALVLGLTARGIPFFYYGSEQGYYGGGVPSNRESLW